MRYLFVLTVLLWSSWAQANLLISPTRVVFSDKERSENVVIINQGAATATYRVEMVINKQDASGGYERLERQKDNLSGLFLADDMIRFSPRQVTLEPGARQTIRMSLRKPDNLAKGEYRAHLGFIQLPDAVALDRDPNASRMQVFMLTSFTIPVQVWQGSVDVKASIKSAAITAEVDEPSKPNQKQWGVKVVLNRTGTFSSFGKLNIYWKPNAQSEYGLLNFIDNASLYREVNTREITVSLGQDKPMSGYYKVEYEGAKELSKQIFDRYEFQYP